MLPKDVDKVPVYAVCLAEKPRVAYGRLKNLCVVVNSDMGTLIMDTRNVKFTREEAEASLKKAEHNRKCRVCGCTWSHGCAGGCYWVEWDLCSRCAEAKGDEG
jgi:hypothetical protein